MTDQSPLHDPQQPVTDDQRTPVSIPAVPVTPPTAVDTVHPVNTVRPVSTVRSAKGKRIPGHDNDNAGGIPIWLPLAALAIALVFALFIASRIGPTLSALVSPPDPVLPPDSVLQSHTSNGTEDQWLYNTKTDGCRVAHVYAIAFGACIYDPSSGCSTTESTPSTQGFGTNGIGNEVAECSGVQTIANYHLAWRVYIGTSGGANSQVYFRVYREVS